MKTKWHPMSTAPKNRCIRVHSFTYATVLSVVWGDGCWEPVLLSESSLFSEFMKRADKWTEMEEP